MENCCSKPLPGIYTEFCTRGNDTIGAGFPNTATTLALPARKAIHFKLDYVYTHTLLYARNLNWNGWLSLGDKRGVRKPPPLQ